MSMAIEAKKKGLRNLIGKMTVLMAKGHADKPMPAGAVSDHVGDAMKSAAGEPEDAEDALDGGVDDGAEHSLHGEPDGEGGGDEPGGEPSFHDEVKNFMRKPLRSSRPDGPGSKVVVRMVSGEAEPPHRGAPPPKAHASGRKPPRFTGRR